MYIVTGYIVLYTLVDMSFNFGYVALFIGKGYHLLCSTTIL